MRLFIILFYLIFFNANAQKTEKIVFKSANPFALSDIITDLENQQEQEVFGKLTFPHHSFDSQAPIEYNEKGYSFKNCLFKLNSEGDVLMNYLNLPMSSPLMQNIGFLFCVDRGVILGGNPESREKAFLFSRSFMLETKKNSSF